MHTRLIALSKPIVGTLDYPTEDLIAFCARVSNPSNQSNLKTAPKLLRYLIDNKHFSPFEMVSMTIEITTSRAIAAQILRHRSFSFQEFSQRYSEVTSSQFIEQRRQGLTNRQVGDEVIHDAQMDEDIQKSVDLAFATYKKMLEAGIARETARMILPLSSTTTLYVAGTIRSWIHYIELRTDHHTQKEHRDIALGCKEIFINNLPNVAEALEWKA